MQKSYLHLLMRGFGFKAGACITSLEALEMIAEMDLTFVVDQPGQAIYYGSTFKSPVRAVVLSVCGPSYALWEPTEEVTPLKAA